MLHTALVCHDIFGMCSDDSFHMPVLLTADRIGASASMLAGSLSQPRWIITH